MFAVFCIHPTMTFTQNPLAEFVADDLESALD
jgi:hypothetical protein